MAITVKDINIKNFIKKFTYTEDQNPENKVVLPTVDFLNIISLLKIELQLRRLSSK